MSILIKMIGYSLLATIFITQATTHAVIQEYLIYFFVLGSFVIAAHEVIKLEDKGEL